VLDSCSEYLAPIAAFEHVSSGFHLAVALEGHRIMDAISIPTTPAPPAQRVIMWKNLERLALGLGLLHSNGLLHRNLNRFSVLTTDPLRSIDFKLTGFEWSCRLIRARPTSSPASDAQGFGSLRDWRQFAMLARELLSLPDDASTSAALPIQAAELDLLTRLERSDELDARGVGEAIRSIAGSLELIGEDRSLQPELVLTLGRDNSLTRAIELVSGGVIAINDAVAQKRFVEADLGQALVVASSSRTNSFIFRLRGKLLEYDVQDFHRTPAAPPSEWVLAECQFAVPVARSWLSIRRQAFVAPFAIAVSSRDGPASPDTRRRSGAWLALREQVDPQGEAVSDDEPEPSLLLNIVLQYLVATANEFPVEILPSPRPSRTQIAPRIDKHVLRVRTRHDETREKLAKLLGYSKPLGTRLHEALAGQSELIGDTWRLIFAPDDSAADEETTQWQFLDPTGASTSFTQYRFVGDAEAPNVSRAFLVPSQMAGAQKTFRRQLQAYRFYCNDHELRRLIEDPRRLIDHRPQALHRDWSDQLDTDKLDALSALLATGPLFLVQGPPGVGKTRLARALVQEVLASSPCSRILLSAQSHAAVDHLLEEITEGVDPDSPETPLIIRCRAREGKRKPTAFDLPRQVTGKLHALKRSPLAQSASAPLQERLAVLTEQSLRGDTHDRTPAGVERHALEALFLRGAQMVFGTSNSGALERLYTDRALFDWTLIEEAAKATGVELLNALLLGGRRALVGDHKQLPPFDSHRMLALLEAPEKVPRLLALVQSLGLRTLWNGETSALFGDFGAPSPEEEVIERAKALCERARKRLFLFESLFESGASCPPDAGVYVKALWTQHRMHPAIADVVRDAFYPRQLKTHEERAAVFTRSAPPVTWIGQSMQHEHAPIVWIKTPWSQAQTGQARSGEQRPVYQNPDEVEAVLWALTRLRVDPNIPTDKKPTLAVLSPYRRQVRALERALARPSARAALQSFVSVGGTFVHTVDSFQGNQAAVVVVSLVRNNGHGTVRGALGFLAEERRMNVLFSRAQWQLVVVGCRRFLNEVVQTHRYGKDAPSIAFLGRLLQSIDRAHASGAAWTIQYEPRRRRARR
jgi:hypothetical protein